jgi:hypothetical protein
MVVFPLNVSNCLLAARCCPLDVFKWPHVGRRTIHPWFIARSRRRIDGCRWQGKTGAYSAARRCYGCILYAARRCKGCGFLFGVPPFLIQLLPRNGWPQCCARRIGPRRNDSNVLAYQLAFFGHCPMTVSNMKPAAISSLLAG